MAITYKAPKGKGKSKHSVGGFINNLGNDARDMLVGIVESPYYIGKAAVHDIKHGNTHETGAMVNAVGRQYKDYYGPLFQHADSIHEAVKQYKQFGQNFYDHPGQLGVDVATVATGGGAAVAKGAQLAAKGGEAGGLAATAATKLGRLQHIDPAAYEALAPHEYKTAIKLADGSALVPGKHSIGGYYDRELSRNPVTNLRQRGTEKLLAKYGSEDSPLGKFTSGYFGEERRGTRLHSKETERLDRRAKQNLLLEAAKASNDLSDHELAASSHRVIGFDNARDYTALVAQRQTLIDQLKREGGKGSARKVAKLQRHLDTITHPEVEKLIHTPSGKMLHAEPLVHDLSDSTQLARAARGAVAGIEPALTVDSRAVQPLRVAHGAKFAHHAPGESVPTKGAIKAERQLTSDETAPVVAPDLYGGMLDSVDPNRRIAIMSMSEDRRAGKGGEASRSYSAGQFKTAEDMHSTGYAFQHALVEPDLRRIIKSASGELQASSSLERFKYIASIAKPLDPTDELQAADLAAGKTVLVQPGADLSRQIGELSNFVTTRLVPIAEGDAEVAAMAEHLAQWNSDIAGPGMVVPKVALDELTRQTQQSFSLYNRLLKVPTRLWRDFTLSLKGSFYANNFLGNLLLGLVAHPIAFVPALARHGFAKTSALGRRIDEVAPDIARSGQAAELSKLSSAERGGAERKLYDLPGRAGEFFQKHGGKFTESNFRRAAMVAEVKIAAKSLRKANGGTHAEAVDLLLNDPRSVDALAQKVYHDLLDYSKLTPFEKTYIRPFLPFWNFTRSIAGRTITLALDEPWKLEVLKAMSETAMRENNKGVFANIQGELPPYLQGLMKVGPTKNGVTPVYSTYAANPFSSVADTLGQVSSLVTGDSTTTQSPLAQFNPYIRSAIEASTGRDLFFDKPLQGTRGHIFASQLANNFPQVASYTRVRYPGASPFVERTPKQSLLQYAGIPLAGFNENNANRNIAMAAYYDNLSKIQQEKYIAKRDLRDRGRLLGMGHYVGVAG